MQSAGISFTWSVTLPAPPLSITSGAPPAAVQGQAYSFQFSVTGGTPPYTWAVTSGTLPAGVTLNASGLLAGTPTSSGSFPLTVTATDSTP